MIQRRVGVNVDLEPPPRDPTSTAVAGEEQTATRKRRVRRPNADIDNSNGNTNGTRNGNGKTTTRHKTKTKTARSGKRRGRRWKWFGLSTVEEKIVTLIQFTSLAILACVGVTLYLYFFGPDEILVEYDEIAHASVYTWKTLALLHANRFFLGREIQIVHPLHRDHDNSFVVDNNLKNAHNSDKSVVEHLENNNNNNKIDGQKPKVGVKKTNDVVFGEKTNDVVFGEKTNDVVFGENTNDDKKHQAGGKKNNDNKKHQVDGKKNNDGKKNSKANTTTTTKGKHTTKWGKSYDILPPSDIYTIPGSMPHIGDKSDAYAQLRKDYDAKGYAVIKPRYEFQTMPMDEHESVFQANARALVEQAGEEEGDDDQAEEGDDAEGADQAQEEGENAEGADQAQEEQTPKPTTPANMPVPYDIHNCPEHPPKNYPYSWNMLRILDHWQPDDIAIPEDLRVFQGICVFDFQTEHQKAMNYRKAEVPFVVNNDPAVQEVANRWNTEGFLEALFGGVPHRTEYSESNHFMYWNAGNDMRKRQHIKDGVTHPFKGDGHPDGRGLSRDLNHWQEPTKMMRMNYDEWLVHARANKVGPYDPHYYYRLIGCGEQSPQGKCDQGSSEYLFDELPFFQPKSNLYMVKPEAQAGIHCRFGMAGIIAENHFDGARNMVAVFGGERRYVLAHPDQCPLVSLLPNGHPSARHSAVDWSNPDLEAYPEFAQVVGNEVVLQAGDVMYIPTHWFHFIISLNVNWQCNTRSGVNQKYAPIIHECGFK